MDDPIGIAADAAAVAAAAKRTPEEAPAAEQPAAKQARPAETINPLTGTAYSRRFHELLERRRKLPCWDARKELLRLLQSSQTLVLVGESGSGKTTQLPQILLDAGYHVQNGQLKSIICTQPCSTSAMCAAARVAEELEVPLGSFVGYNVDFETKASPDTLLKMTTYSALLRDILIDPTVSAYSVIILDEAHLRCRDADILCSVLKKVLPTRPELRLIIAAANKDAPVMKLRSFFSECPVLQVPGRMNPVEIMYLSASNGPSTDKDYIALVIKTVVQIHGNESDGDVLVFLPTEDDMDYIATEIKKEAQKAGSSFLQEIVVFALHGSQSLELNLKAFEPAPPAKTDGGRPGRRVVLSTGIAETSLALDGIAFVVDTGFGTQRVYNPRKRLDCEMVVGISKPSAVARASCAGRSAMGKCYRLYPERSFGELPEKHHPEMLRSNICWTVLLLKALGFDSVANFEFVDPPSIEAMLRALESLNYLGFLDAQGALTQDGVKAARFPVEPQIAKMLLEAPKHKCSNEALSIAAMLTVSPVFLRPRDAAKQAEDARNRFAHLDGDHLTLLNVFHAYKQKSQDGEDAAKFCAAGYINLRSMKLAEAVRDQLKKLMEALGLQMISTSFQDKEYYPNILRCLVSGFFQQVGVLSPAKIQALPKYLLMRNGHEVNLHPTTCLQNKPDWVLYHEYSVTSSHVIQVVSQIKDDWLLDLSPAFFDPTTMTDGEAKTKLEKSLARRNATSVD
eukprot:TRINITY_DN101192_c0_g1_i1.p1 TRINITY_DN101192_c0_g1~~TRINITY_DN101192_c0_g1_i1.p1  ORF type:complete len:738 (+),score=136.83 TRINITY_DN101192_c0_g1_i1:79-2292(+)